MSPLVFVHIPKTAGSSFRMGVDKQLGKRASLRDYGLNSPETSAEIKRLIYAAPDTWKLKSRLQSGKTRLIVGHFPVMRYVGLVGAGSIFTLVRDPIQRVISEYGHFKRHYGFKGNLLQFARRPTFVNKQARMLEGVPLEAIGLIGITERYEETLVLFDRLFGFRPPNMKENKARAQLDEDYGISRRQRDELHRLNARDVILYETAREIFDRRRASMARSEPLVRGRVTQIADGAVKGWAVRDHDESPVVVEVLVDDEVIGSTVAVEFKPRASGLGMGRGGFIGFSFDLPESKREGRVQCRADGAGFFFPGGHRS